MIDVWIGALDLADKGMITSESRSLGYWWTRVDVDGCP